MVLGDENEPHSKQFLQLPAYADRLLEADPSALVNYRISPSEQRFSMLFVSPSRLSTLGNPANPFLASMLRSPKLACSICSLWRLAGMRTRRASPLLGTFCQWRVQRSDVLCGTAGRRAGVNWNGWIIMTDRQTGLLKAKENVSICYRGKSGR